MFSIEVCHWGHPYCYITCYSTSRFLCILKGNIFPPKIQKAVIIWWSNAHIAPTGKTLELCIHTLLCKGMTLLGFKGRRQMCLPNIFLFCGRLEKTENIVNKHSKQRDVLNVCNSPWKVGWLILHSHIQTLILLRKKAGPTSLLHTPLASFSAFNFMDLYNLYCVTCLFCTSTRMTKPRV